jgi:peptidoglycan/LPS O-acetylase OafA/YrhL
MIKQIKKSKPVQNKDKLLGLEIIRFISSISILIWHYQHFFYTNEQRIDFVKENQPFYSILSLFYEYGFYGVHVFWSISGFIFFWK